MKANKILLSLFTLLTIVFVGCKEDETEFYALNIDNKEIFQNETYKFYVENYQGSISWSIDEDKIASIDQNGQVKGLKVGSTFVHAYLSNGMHLMSSLTVSQSAIEIPFKALQLSTTKDYTNPKETKFILEVKDSLYLDESKYPLHVTLNRIQDQTTPSLKNESEEERELLETTIKYELRTAEDGLPAGYNITVIPGEEEAKYYCKLELGPYYIDFDITVSYGVYLSHNQINPDNLNEGIGLLTYKTMIPEDSKTLNYMFFCYLDDPTPEQVANIKQQIMNKENYKFENLNMIIGDITIDDSEPVWQVYVPLSVETDSYQKGILTLSIEDKDLVLDLTVDDGSTFSELYVSFEQIYTYSEETKLSSRTLDNAYFSYIGGVSPEAGIGDHIKMTVWYTMTPDDRGDFIEWDIKVPEDAPVKYIGSQKINTQQFEFDFEVVKAGKANIEVSIQNPKADDPQLTSEEKAMYEDYRVQTLSALFDVKDRADVEVESVLFLENESSDSDPITEDETIMKVYNLYTYITPEESAGAWPSVFSVECFDGAAAEVTQSSYSEELKADIPGSVIIKHAGKIVVTATAKDKTATLTLTAKMKIDQNAEGEKLQLSTTKNEYIPGETDKVKTVLRTDFEVYPDEYTWETSDPNIVEIDEEGNFVAKADGSATITVSIEDDFGYKVTATKIIKVRTVSADANFNDSKWDEYYVIETDVTAADGGGTYYIDTVEGSDNFLIVLDKSLTVESGSDDRVSVDGVYTFGTDISGTITFPTNDIFTIDSGTITISNNEWTFDLKISNSDASGTIKGTKTFEYIIE